MNLPLSAPEILNREFLEIRCKILELAAAFDQPTSRGTQLLAALNWRQEDLATYLHVSRKAVNQWLSGRVTPRPIATASFRRLEAGLAEVAAEVARAEAGR